MSKIEAIIDFWFEGINQPDQMFGAVPSLFVNSAEEFINKIRSQFFDDIDKAISGEYDEWMSSPRGCLALIIILDQFTRYMFKESADEFKGDPKAISVAEHFIQQGFEDQQWLAHLMVVYLPFEHSEEKKHQELSVQKFTELVAKFPQNLKNEFIILSLAKINKRTIDRFGRFPNRNSILGRANTEEEEKYLNEDEYFYGVE